MALRQSIAHARPADFDEVLARTGEALDGLRTRHADGSLPLLRLPQMRDDIAPILGYAALLRDGTSDVVFLGTGGSSLGGQTLAQLAGYAVPVLGGAAAPPAAFLGQSRPRHLRRGDGAAAAAHRAALSRSRSQAAPARR